MIAGVLANQRHAQERGLPQVEDAARFLARDPARDTFSSVGRHAFQVHDEGTRREPFVDNLPGFAVDHGKARAKRFVPGEQRTQAERHGLEVERAPEPQANRDIERRAFRVELRHQPQPLLRERQLARTELPPARNTGIDGALNALAPEQLFDERAPFGRAGDNFCSHGKRSDRLRTSGSGLWAASDFRPARAKAPRARSPKPEARSPKPEA